jgi:nucleoside phosphorylase
MLTGEAVLSDESSKRNIYSAFKGKQFIGGEMEGYGLYDECLEHTIPCVVVKSICDWGSLKNGLDEDKKRNDILKDSLQAYAMNNTMTVLNYLFQDESFFFFF